MMLLLLKILIILWLLLIFVGIILSIVDAISKRRTDEYVDDTIEEWSQSNTSINPVSEVDNHE